MPSLESIDPSVNSLFTDSNCNTVSGGSAAFLFVALILGNLSQLAGFVPPYFGSWRVWRLSPLFCGLEGAHNDPCPLQRTFQARFSEAACIHNKVTSATHECFTRKTAIRSVRGGTETGIDLTYDAADLESGLLWQSWFTLSFCTTLGHINQRGWFGYS